MGTLRPIVVLLCCLSRPSSGAEKYFPPHVDINFANDHWESKGCREQGFDELNVFGAVRLALKTEYREVSLAIDGAWMDRFLDVAQRVVVTCIPHGELAWTALPMPDLDGMGWAPKTPEEDVLQAIYSYTPPAELATSALESSALEQPVDRFMLHNPCWLVLHDAVTSNASHHLHHHRAPVGLGSSTVAPGIYTHANILVKMPAFPLQMTCKLFLAVTERQFPARCPRKEDRFFYAMQSFGFGGEANKVIKTFAFNLADHDSRIYTAPPGASYGWAWADPQTCGQGRYRHDPWSCSFLPVSNCTLHGASAPAFESSEPEVADLLKLMSPGWGDYGPGKDAQHAFLRKLKIDGNMLIKFGDGATLNKEPATWASVRLYALLLRPNLRSRYFMRRVLDSRIVRLRRAKAADGAINGVASGVSLRGVAGPARHRADEVDADATAAGEADTAVPQGLGAGLGLASGWGRSCLGMHVRNADVLTDWRNGRKVDRSFNAHVYVAHNITRGLGLYDVFLATDNASLYRIAPLEFPEYRWFAQQRPITAYEQQAARGSQHHLHEAEPQKEIANLLVDALLVGRCEAMVGQGDGSVTLLFHMLSCNLGNAACACPPFFDLQRIVDDGIMPYVGAHFDATTSATFHKWKEDG